MTILHYTIGLPPSRHGGSVQYAFDLMQEQSRQGHKIIALTCGDTLFRSIKTKIKSTGKVDSVDTYCLTNPLTPTLIYGVSDPDSQHRKVKLDEQNICDFIDEKQITILHLHTFMGLHSDVVRIFKERGVKIIYTSHDFHGICPHYNLINEKGELCNAANGKNCARCNFHEPSDLFLRLANSYLYQKLKNKIKKKLSVKSGDNSDMSNVHFQTVDLSRIEAFERLLEYYRDYFSLIDTIHFNSSQTRDVFRLFLPGIDGTVIPVITKGIADRRRSLETYEIITFGFIGSTADYKGFPILKQVVSELYEEDIRNFAIKVYGTPIVGIDKDCPLIEYCGTYKYSDISDVLYHLDGTIVPSKCYETFSLVTLESLAHGRPVIVSDHVGAKDIVARYNPKFIFSDKEQLKSLLKECINDGTILRDFNSAIINKNWVYSLANHTNEIINLYSNDKKIT